jgi:tetratricopeptide (TPR) repeat protein
MVGVNDWVGTVRYENNPQTKIVLFLKDLRVFKLGRTIYLNLSQLFSKHSFMVGSSAEAKTYISESSDAPSVAIERHVRLGNMYCDQHKYWLSEQLLERAMQIDPQDGFACHCLVVCYKNQGRYEDALGVLKDYIRLSNNNEGVCVDLGDIYMTLNRYSEAETMYKKALEFNPKYEPAYTGLGLCYTLEGKGQNNYKLAQKIASENIENDRMHGFVAAVYDLHGEHDKALEYSRKAEEFRSRYYNPATRHNYQLIKDMVSQKGAKLICMQYPLRSIDSLKKMFDSVDGVIFVENKRPFIDAIKLGKHEDYFTDNFGGDFGHCTRKGNRLIAENVADTISNNSRR